MMTISQLRRSAQIIDLGGQDVQKLIQDELREIRIQEAELRNYRRQIEEFRLHLSNGHAWITNDETNRTQCAICGWEGDV